MKPRHFLLPVLVPLGVFACGNQIDALGNATEAPLAEAGASDSAARADSARGDAGRPGTGTDDDDDASGPDAGDDARPVDPQTLDAGVDAQKEAGVTCAPVVTEGFEDGWDGGGIPREWSEVNGPISIATPAIDGMYAALFSFNLLKYLEHARPASACAFSMSVSVIVHAIAAADGAPIPFLRLKTATNQVFELRASSDGNTPGLSWTDGASMGSFQFDWSTAKNVIGISRAADDGAITVKVDNDVIGGGRLTAEVTTVQLGAFATPNAQDTVRFDSIVIY